MTDFLRECNTGDIATDPKSFQEVWCARCRRRECDLARWRQDRFSARVAHQPERFFNPQSADLAVPRFAQIATTDFPSLLQKALRLEVASRRNDWSIPEIPILDGRTVLADESTTRHVDDAVRQLTRGRGPEPEPLEENDPEPEPEPDIGPELESPLPPSTPAPAHPKPPVVPPTKPNIVQPSEQMIDGSPPPPKAQQPTDDPWAPKAQDTAVKVKPGAKIRFGLTGVKVDE